MIVDRGPLSWLSRGFLLVILLLACNRLQGGPAAATPVRPTSTPLPLASGLNTELVADGLQLPANLAFAPDGRLFLTEVSLGNVRVVEAGRLLPEPVATLDVTGVGEQGLLGLALDPDFGRSHYLYLFYSQAAGSGAGRNRIVRMTEAGNRAGDLQVVLDDLPIQTTARSGYNATHNGGRLAFGPDGKLYVTVGDVVQPQTAQDRAKLSGKLLRLNRDGSVPADNPVPGSPVYAMGLRNSWGLAFHPARGAPYVTDNGPHGHDEVNRIEAGGNYGSPDVSGIVRDPRFADPIWESSDDGGGITGLTFYSGSLFPLLRNDLLFCSVTNGQLVRLHLSPDEDQVLALELLSSSCHLDVTPGPDGAIYFSSVNQVLRLVPAP